MYSEYQIAHQIHINLFHSLKSWLTPKLSLRTCILIRPYPPDARMRVIALGLVYRNYQRVYPCTWSQDAYTFLVLGILTNISFQTRLYYTLKKTFIWRQHAAIKKKNRNLKKNILVCISVECSFALLGCFDFSHFSRYHFSLTGGSIVNTQYAQTFNLVIKMFNTDLLDLAKII